jgi:hypothetical protein
MSKKIRTVEMLDDKLSEEISWRKKELSIIWSEIQSASPIRQKALIRGGIALLYAHWEGFIKQSGAAYLEFVSQQRLRWEELSPSFVALGIKAKINEATQTNKAIIYTEVAEFFLNRMDERCRINYKGAVNTQSNLSAEIFKDIVCMLDLDYSFFVTKENLIDERLVAYRNSIAHGEYLKLNEPDYREIHEQVIAMINNFRNQIENAALMESYLR